MSSGVSDVARTCTKLDDGGLVQESGRRLKNLDDALAALEAELEKWFEQNG